MSPSEASGSDRSDPFLGPTVLAMMAVNLVGRAERDHGGGIGLLSEKRDLEPAVLDVLQLHFADRVFANRKVMLPVWQRVGHVDVVVTETPSPASLFDSALVELKWCRAGEDILHEAIWDLFKTALGVFIHAIPAVRGYLVTGAKRSVWESSGFAGLFESGEHDPVELCARRLANRARRLAWDHALDGGYDSFPNWVPGRIRTTVTGRAAVGDDY
jgi:hypothetical protein